MISWLCYKILKTGRKYSHEIDESCDMPIVLDDYTPNMDRAIRFAVLPARGGCVFETRIHDPKSREWNTVTHVIPEGSDVAKEVGAIVAMELLRN